MCFRCSLGLKYVEMFHKQRKSKVALRLITWLHWYQSQMFYTYSTRVYKTASFLHSSSHSPQYINNSKLTLVLSNPLWLCAMILDSKGKTGGFFFCFVLSKMWYQPPPPCLPSHLSLVCVCFFPPLSSTCKRLPLHLPTRRYQRAWKQNKDCCPSLMEQRGARA